MDPALTATLLAATTGLASAFVAYWSGVARTERRYRQRENELLDELDIAVDLLAASDRHPAGRHLRVVKNGA